MGSTSNIHIQDGSGISQQEFDDLVADTETEREEAFKKEFESAAPGQAEEISNKCKEDLEKLEKVKLDSINDSLDELKDNRTRDNRQEYNDQRRELQKAKRELTKAVDEILGDLEDVSSPIIEHYMKFINGEDATFSKFTTGSFGEALYIIETRDPKNQTDQFADVSNASTLTDADAPAAAPTVAAAGAPATDPLAPVDPLAPPTDPAAQAPTSLAQPPSTAKLPQTITLQIDPSLYEITLFKAEPLTFKITNKTDFTAALVEFRGDPKPKIVIAGKFPADYTATIKKQWPEEIQKICYLEGQKQSIFERLNGGVTSSDEFKASLKELQDTYPIVWEKLGTAQGQEGEGYLSADSPPNYNPKVLYDEAASLLLEGKTWQDVVELWRNGAPGIDPLNEADMSVMARVLAVSLIKAEKPELLGDVGYITSIINYDASALHGAPIVAEETPVPTKDGSAPKPVEKNLGVDNLSAQDKAALMTLGGLPDTILTQVKDEAEGAGSYDENILAITIANELGGMKGQDVPGLIKAQNDLKIADAQKKVDDEKAYEDGLKTIHLPSAQETSLSSHMNNWVGWDPTNHGASALQIIEALKNTENLSTEDLQRKIITLFQTTFSKDIQGSMAFWLISGLVRFAPDLANALLYNSNGSTNTFANSLNGFANSNSLILGLYSPKLGTTADLIKGVQNDSFYVSGTGSPPMLYSYQHEQGDVRVYL